MTRLLHFSTLIMLSTEACATPRGGGGGGALGLIFGVAIFIAVMIAVFKK
jgi:hypothetical protein